MESKVAHKYFWVYVLVIAGLILGMIYFTSKAQQDEQDQYKAQQTKTEQLASELDKEKTNSKALSEKLNTEKGLTESVQKLQDENKTLQEELNEKNAEIASFAEETLNYKTYGELLTAYVNRDFEACKTLKDKINRKYLAEADAQMLDKIASEIQ